MSSESMRERPVAVWRSLALMGRRVAAELERTLQESAGVSTPEFEVLLALSGAEDGQARARDLGNMLVWEKSRVSHLVTRMVGRGLLERTHCDTDMRGTWVAITPAGAAALEAATPGYAAVLDRAFGGRVDADDAVVLIRTAAAVATALDPDTCRDDIDSMVADAVISAPAGSGPGA